ATPAFQGSHALPQRSWGIAVQLYSIRSHRNWGHGDFTDLANLIDVVSELGASAIGLNPLHALFDDRAEEASPYFPSSRLFLNPLYIDIDTIPECPSVALADFEPHVAALRHRDLVDYAGVARCKAKALRLAFDAFLKLANETRRREFDDFKRARAPLLQSFTAFEVLRRHFGKPWWEWPVEL